MPVQVVDQILLLLRENSTLVVPEPLDRDACRDPDDLHVLGLAAAGQAVYLITGDKDLLALKRFRKCRIVSPREFSMRIHDKQAAFKTRFESHALSFVPQKQPAPHKN